jgi:hypothetical protein
MAKEQKSKAGWLERRRNERREKATRRGRRVAEKRANEAATGERSGPGSPNAV